MKWKRESVREDLEAMMRRKYGLGEADEDAIDCSLDELSEFLETDLAGVPVDLEFKQDLREKLWELVRTRNRQRRGRDRR